MISFSKDLYAGRTDLLLNCEINILKLLNFDFVFPDPFSILMIKKRRWRMDAEVVL